MLVDVKSDVPTRALDFQKSSRNSTAQKFSPATQPPCQGDVLLNQAKSWWTQQTAIHEPCWPSSRRILQSNSSFLKVRKRSYHGVTIVLLSRRLHKFKISE